MAKKAYIVITHRFTPNPDSKSKDDAWNVNETCEFVDELKNRMKSEATVILDYKEKRLNKNRLDHGDYETFLYHVKERYEEQFEQFKKVVDGKDNTN